MAPSSSIVAKIKVQLKLSISRLRMVQQKDTAIAKQQRRAMAQLLEVGKEESARIRVENIIRSDITTELLEILELYCELLLARVGLLEAKECDAGLEEAVKSLIYAAPRTDIKELQTTRALLMDKYGKEFALQAIENGDGKVADRVLEKLKIEPPPRELVTLYLTEIARTYGVDWPRGSQNPPPSSAPSSPPSSSDNDEPGSGGQALKSVEAPLKTDELSRATPPRDDDALTGPRSPVSVAPPKPRTDNVSPKIRLPQPPPGLRKGKGDGKTQGEGEAKSLKDDEGGKVGGRIPDVDELAKRFAALKK
ncbi:MAG: hypothetical protein M1832_000456 [Thelocarpon impressellum]|nr:MAG: hypothetical protein M1832_000456 [Thelocarpon impressellum]